MSAKAWVLAAVGAGLLAATASAQRLPGDASRPVKPGLWQITEHNNWGMFVVRHDLRPPEERARISAEFLKHTFFKRACMNEEQAKHPDRFALPADGCKAEAVRSAGRITTLDAVCSGNRDGTRKAHVADQFDSPEHLMIEVTRTLDPEAGYPVLETYDMRWLSADCGDLPAGGMRYISRPQPHER